MKEIIIAIIITPLVVVGIVVGVFLAYVEWWIREDWKQEYGNDAGSPTRELE